MKKVKLKETMLLFTMLVLQHFKWSTNFRAKESGDSTAESEHIKLLD